RIERAARFARIPERPEPASRANEGAMHSAPSLAPLRLALAFFTVASPALAQNWPDGPGKEQVVATCGGGHDINRLRIGYTPEGWLTVTRMMQNFDTPIAPEDWPAVTTYLMKNFPERERPKAAIISGPAQATIKTWPVPTQGSRPHDP